MFFLQEEDEEAASAAARVNPYETTNTHSPLQQPARSGSHRHGDNTTIKKRGGRARRRTAPTDLAQMWATQARPRRRAWARGSVQRKVDAGLSPSTRRPSRL